MIPEAESENFNTFKDCLASTVIQRLAPAGSKARKKVKGRKNEIKPVVVEEDSHCDASDLSEFIEYLAEEIFASLLDEVRSLSFAAVQNDQSLRERVGVPLDTNTLEDLTKSMSLSVSDSLCAYGLIAERLDTGRFLETSISAYLSSASAAPPEYTPAIAASRPDGCEICSREQLPLTYHHLIPREMHAKAVKRGWHREWELNKVAWLCRACHSYVHRIAPMNSWQRSCAVWELLLEREDVQKFALWVSKIRWKAR